MVENEPDRFVDIPRIARYLMQTLPLGDGRVRFVDRPQLFKSDDVERLVERSYSPGVSVGGSHAPVVKSWWRASSLSSPHLVAVSR